MATSNPIEVKKSAPGRSGVPDIWSTFRNDVDRLFGNGFGFPPWPRLPTWPRAFFEPSETLSVPAVDVAETDGNYTVTAELPGMDEKDIDVSLAGDMLTIKGEKRQEKEEKDKNYYLSERSYGQFQRSFTLPAGIDRDKIAAEFSKGVLKLTLPKSAEAQKQQKKIEVKKA